MTDFPDFPVESTNFSSQIEQQLVSKQPLIEQGLVSFHDIAVFTTVQQSLSIGTFLQELVYKTTVEKSAIFGMGYSGQFYAAA